MRFPSLPPWALVLRLILLWALTLPLISCGDLPEPFIGQPGATARRLAWPVTPPMLAVMPPDGALLDGQSKDDFADLLALSLQKQEVPTLARTPQKTDWRLAVTAQRNGDLVVPHYTILDPAGKEQGAIDGGALSASGWTTGTPVTLGAAAQDAAPKILALMLSIRRTRDRANPNSLVNRAAKLFVPAVTGAPGDGNTSLTRMIRADLAEIGPLLQPKPEGADFIVTGKVTVSPLPKGQQQVEIAWTVTWPNGNIVGKVSQLNTVPAGSLDLSWGDVAGAVAQEAAGGINSVVEHFIDSNKEVPGDAAAHPKAGAAGLPASVSSGLPATGPDPGTSTGSITTPAADAAPAKTTANPVQTVEGKRPAARPNPVSVTPKESVVPTDASPAKPAGSQ